MGDWITVPNTNWDSIKQGVDVSKNPKDYVRDIRSKEQEESKTPPIADAKPITPTKVKINDVSEITNKFDRTGGK